MVVIHQPAVADRAIEHFDFRPVGEPAAGGGVFGFRSFHKCSNQSASNGPIFPKSCEDGQKKIKVARLGFANAVSLAAIGDGQRGKCFLMRLVRELVPTARNEYSVCK